MGNKRRRALLAIHDVMVNLPATRASESTVRHWIGNGQLPSTKVGRHRLVRRVDLAAFLGVPVDDVIDADDVASGDTTGPQAA